MDTSFKLCKVLVLCFVCCFISSILNVEGTTYIQPVYDRNDFRLFDYKITNILECNATSEWKSNMVLKWKKNKKDVSPIDIFTSEGTPPKYEVKQNKLYIRRVTEDDVSFNYSCHVEDENGVELEHAVFYILGKPMAKIESLGTYMEGQNITLKCVVWGKPTPSVEWRYGDTLLDREQGRITLEDNVEALVMNAYLKIQDAQLTDRGEYQCTARHPEVDFNATAVEFVRVKDKYAALWPFIGICAEVLVLCTVILVYERKRNKAELEESDTDQSPEQKNTPDHGKESVRQRK